MVNANESSKLITVRRAFQPLAQFSNLSSCDQPVAFPHRTILNGNAPFSNFSHDFCCYFCSLMFSVMLISQENHNLKKNFGSEENSTYSVASCSIQMIWTASSSTTKAADRRLL